ncbi:MAG: hypothetical protein RLZZ59_48 [Pseudomonadota bacterium]
MGSMSVRLLQGVGMNNKFSNISGYDYRESEIGSRKNIHSALMSWDVSERSLVTRLIFIICFMVLCFSAIAVKLVIVALSTPDPKKTYARDEYFRREIVDRNGVLLAINLHSSSLFANPGKMIDLEDAATKISNTLTGVDKKKLLNELKSSKSFVWIKRGLTEKEKHEVHSFGIPGLGFEEEPRRVYTYGNLFSHLIGYVGRDNEGLAGLEQGYNDFLTDKHVNGKSVSEPLRLTVDARIQSIVHEELLDAVTKFRAAAGIAVVIDDTNGEIVASVSLPDFNPHNPSKATEAQLFNRYSLGVEEMGSIMKMFPIAIGLETDKITLNDVYDLTAMRIANFDVKDYHKSVGWHSVPEIFLNSSNIGMAQIILEIGKHDYRKYIERLGLMQRLPVDIPERGSPLIPSFDKWNDLSLATMSYGYAHAITPLHFLSASLPVVNGGYMYPLHFVKKEGAIERTKVLSESTSIEMRKLLRLTATKGTGKKGNVDGYFVGAKTGTAEMRVGRKYVKNMRKSSFFAVTPAHDPKYVVYIMLDNPQPTKETFGFATAGWTAAPVAKNIISRMMTLYGVPPYKADPEIENSLSLEYAIDDEA